MTRCRYNGDGGVARLDATKVDKKVQVTIDYDAMNKFIMPRTLYNGKLYGGVTNIGELGILELDGSSVSVGELAPKTTDQIQQQYGIDGVAFFMFINDSTQAAGQKERLLRSVDPMTTAFVDVTPAGGLGDGTIYYDGIVNCVTGTQTVLFLFSYGQAAGNNRAYYSTDDGATWTDLFGKAASGIAHFHGAYFKADATPNGGTLYVYCGDGAATSGATGVAWTDDVDDLIADSDTWFDRWGLGGTLAVPTPPTENFTYTIGRSAAEPFGVQAARVIQLVDDGDKGYWLSDGEGGDFVELDFAAKTIRIIKADLEGVQYGWTGIKTSAGDLLFTTGSGFDVAGGDFQPNSDRYLRIFAANDDRTDIVEVARIPRADYSPTVNPLVSSANLEKLIEYQGSLWVSGRILPYGEDLYGQIAATNNSYIAFRIANTDDLTNLSGDWMYPSRKFSWPIASNITRNPQFEEDTVSVPTYWTAALLGTGGTFLIDPTVVEGGHTNSAKIDLVGGAGQGAAQIQGLNLATVPALKKVTMGNFVTLAAKIRISSTYADGGTGSNLRPALGITGAVGNSGVLRFPLDTTLFDDEWHEVWLTSYLPRTATNIWPTIYADITGGGLRSGTVYVSDVRFTLGCLPAANNMPSYQYFQ